MCSVSEALRKTAHANRMLVLLLASVNWGGIARAVRKVAADLVVALLVQRLMFLWWVAMRGSPSCPSSPR